MRIVHFAGFPNCGKTEIIRRVCEGKDADCITNNGPSADRLKDVCRNVDSFPFRSPCARIRQYGYRIDMMREHSPEVIITEPPGNCMEVSAPMLNQIYIGDKNADIGPLITVVDGRKMTMGISKRDSEGLRIYNMIDESDVLVVSFSDQLSDDDKKRIADIVSEINPDARIVFSGPDSDLSELADIVFGDAKYNRPLYN